MTPECCLKLPKTITESLLKAKAPGDTGDNQKEVKNGSEEGSHVLGCVFPLL